MATLRHWLNRWIVCRLKGHDIKLHTMSRAKRTAYAFHCARCDTVLATASKPLPRMAVPRSARR